MTFLKLRFYGAYWKIDLVMRLASLLRLKSELYAGGSGNGEWL